MQLSNYDNFPADIPLIVNDDGFLYPFMIVPLFISDKDNINAINYAIDNNKLLFVAVYKDNKEKKKLSQIESIYDVGIIGSIMRKVALSDGRIKILFQGLSRGIINQQTKSDIFICNTDLIVSDEYKEVEVTAMLKLLKEKVSILSSVNGQFTPDLLKTIDDNSDVNRIIDLISSVLTLEKEQAYTLLKEHNIETRLLLIIEIIIKEIEVNRIQNEIQNKASSNIDKINKEYYLKEQLRQIQHELGVDRAKDEEIEEYYKKLKKIKSHIHEDGYTEIKKQLDRYAKMNPDSSDAHVLQNYIETVFEIPFNKKSKHVLKIETVESQLNKDHYSLIKPKNRIIEFFAVKELLQLRGKSTQEKNGTILCFIGPPGVGKTSLANSIATALKRKLVRVALGGLEDVSELRGHRRTYVGSMPGRIIQGLIDAKAINPVIVLDEIDKVGRSVKGDPSSVLLEILDPEQNSSFRDNYLNFPVNISDAIFIATANDIGTIPPALKDRMEFIEVSSYTPNEKYEIAKKYLIPQELKKHGLNSREVVINKTALEIIIEKYVREAGVRNLRRKIATIMRKATKQILAKTTNKITINTKNINEFLDKPIFEIQRVTKGSTIGVVNGLAWTSVGGDVLKIEAIKIKGKGALQLTGSLGDVMKESAYIAKSVVQVLINNNKLSTPKIINIDNSSEEQLISKAYDLHIHVPEGATPKDGPSAGIAMATTIASIYSNKAVRNDVAMTGELNLSGDVMPIGGLKEKLIAAHKANIKLALIPQKNYENDLADIPEEVKNDMKIVSVNRIEEVLNLALV